MKRFFIEPASFARAWSIASLAFGLGCLPWYLAEFPGLITLDTVDQMWQADRMKPIDDLHSVTITLALRAVRPFAGVLVFAQYLSFSVVFAGLLALAARGFARPAKTALWPTTAAALVCGLLPSLGAQLFTIIKDVPYAICFLGFAAAWALVLRSKRYTPRAGLVLGSLSGLPWLFRHDGVLVVIFASVIALLVVVRTPAPWKGWLGGFAAGLLLAVTLHAAASRLAGSVPGPTRWTWAVAFVHDIAAVATWGDLDDVDHAFIAQWGDHKDLAANYDPAKGDVYFLGVPKVKLDWFTQNHAPFAAGYVRIVKKNLALVARKRVARSLHHFGLRDQNLFADPRANPENTFGFRVTPIVFSNTAFQVLATTSSVKPLRLLVWASALPLVGLLALTMMAVRRRNWALVVWCALPVLNALAFSFVAPAAYFRYNYYVLPFLFVGFFAWWADRTAAREALWAKPSVDT
ncbi:MAG: hypothetical protein ACOZIN_10735 [Myxococcota bacterium]